MKNQDVQLFVSRVVRQFDSEYDEKLDVPRNRSLVMFLIDAKLISETQIQRYNIISSFHEELPKHDYHKSRTICILADRFEKSERQIWNIMKSDLYRNRRRDKNA